MRLLGGEKKLLENAKIARGISFDKASRVVVLCGGLALNREKNVWQLIHNNVKRSQFFNLLNKDEIARSTISDLTIISANFPTSTKRNRQSHCSAPFCHRFDLLNA